jgi:hypothetical protein
MNECLSDLALDDREIHGARPPDAERHLDGCERCRARLHQRAGRVAEWDGALAAPAWQAVLARRRAALDARRRWRLAWPAALALAGGMAALALVARPNPPGPAAPAPYIGAKGRAAPAQIVARRDGRTFVVGVGGEPVAPGDQLVFRPLPVWPDARFIQIGSVDGTGAYTSFYPPASPAGGARSVPLPASGRALDGGIVLDDAPGPERLFVVLSAAPLAEADVRAAALADGARGGVPGQIAGTPVVSAWIVLPKRAAGPAGGARR